MYYRYRSKNRNNKVFNIFIFILITGNLVFWGIKYNKYLLFWKYSYNKLEKDINEAAGISDPVTRKKTLLNLVKLSQDYKEEKSLNADAYLLSGKVHFLLGLDLLNVKFSQLVIKDAFMTIKNKSKVEFQHAIKDIRKGFALVKGKLHDENYFHLARAAYYTRHCSIEEIYKILNDIRDPKKLKNIEDLRFYAYVLVLSGKVEEGLGYLRVSGKIPEDLESILFLATLERIARKYTNAIIEYKQALEKTKDPMIIKNIHLNLGKIYYNQSLYRESLSHFNTALGLDNQDNVLKLWTGKSYAALGDRQQASAIWGEVLVSDSTNQEARKLLGLR